MRTTYRTTCVRRVVLPCPEIEDADLDAWAEAIIASPAINPRHRRIVADLLADWRATR